MKNDFRIPLETRIKRLKQGSPSNPDFTVSVIKTMAEMPITEYLSTFESEQEMLMKILNLSEKQFRKLTYQDIAARIRNKWLLPKERQMAIQAMDLLTAPIRKCYEERKRREED